MNHRILIVSLLVASLPMGAAHAQNPAPDFVFFDAQIAALQHRIDARTANASLSPEALQALQGKQAELVNQEAKLKAAGTMTPDEKAALALSVRQQQQRLMQGTPSSTPAMKHVDPSSLPAPTYVAPNGTTISGAPGSTPAQNGVVPLTGPTIPVIHAPQPVTAEPAQQ